MSECPFYNALSPLHGRGLFANRYFPYGTVLLQVTDNDGNVTENGRLINHSSTPNIMLHKEADGWYAVAIIPIYQGREILGNYARTPDCIEKPSANWK